MSARTRTNFERRHFLRILSGSTVSAFLAAGISARAKAHPATRSTSFTSIPHGVDANHHVAEGYAASVLIRWGDSLTNTAYDLEQCCADAATQARCFGYNNDFVAYFPFPGRAGNERGLLCVNHEYTNPDFMWDFGSVSAAQFMTASHTAIEQAAIGHSVVEVKRTAAGWETVAGRYNRRLTATSPVRLSGPAAGHARVKTRTDESGRLVRGILNACGGGKTPWGTVLIAEENFNLYFGGNNVDARESLNHQRYAVGETRHYPWWRRYDQRFDVSVESREANRFGWVVELDPFDPEAMPVKRTALGRFKHEAATCVLNTDGRAVVYSGDDGVFEYLYRFVSRNTFDTHRAGSSQDLLDDGELSVARFHADGWLEWLPLRHGHGPLVARNGFANQGDVVIEARRAADLLGATRLDRPEDVETNPQDGCVYAMLTGNPRRTPGNTDPTNPRAPNRHGHVLRLRPPGAPGQRVEHAARHFEWEVFLLAGDPQSASHGARYPGKNAEVDWFVAPDNCTFDPAGRLWIATDQGRNWPATGFADGVWCIDEMDPYSSCKALFRAPIGAEVSGPEFTPDGRTLFLSIQHPGVDGVQGSNFRNPGTRWPDFLPGVPPRPAVLAIYRPDGRPIGD